MKVKKSFCHVENYVKKRGHSFGMSSVRYYGSPNVSEGASDQIIGGADTAHKKPALMPRSSFRGRVYFARAMMMAPIAMIVPPTILCRKDFFSPKNM